MGQEPFVLIERPDGRRELRAFSDDSPDPIVLILDDEDGRLFAVALADVLTALDSGAGLPSVTLRLAGRRVCIEGRPDSGLRLTVAR